MTYLVEKLPDGELRPWVHDEYRETGMIMSLEPGKTLVLVDDAGTDEAALRQAEAYWNGTHQEPEQINAWVERALERK